MNFTKIQKMMLAIILLCLLVSSSSEAAPQTQLATPLEPTGGVINSPTKPQGFPVENQNQPILGQPSSSSVNQPLTGLNQPLTGFNQPSTTELNQPILGQPSSTSSVNQPLTGFNQPSSTGFNQPSSNSALGQPFANRINQNSLSGNNVPFLNGNSKLEVSITRILSICIAFLLSLHDTGMN